MKTLRYTFGALCAILLAATAGAADIKPTGTVYLANGGSSKGTIVWRNGSKSYVVTDATGRSTSTFKEDEVERVDVTPPKDLERLAKAVVAGSNLPATVKSLEEIVDAYDHLTYDVIGTRWLAQAYLKQGNTAKAVSACEKVIRSNPEAAYAGEMAPAYWEALRKSNPGKLQGLLDKAIASGDRISAASALVARGDAALGADNAAASTAANCQIALRDGYLRVILLYADPSTEAYPEALYKGAQAFKKMGQSSRATQLLDTLKAECPNSPWARM